MSARSHDPSREVWEVRETGPTTLAWAFDPRDGAVQGPLDLASFAGATLLLTLEPGQTALLVRDGQPQRAWLEGSHLLAVGDAPGELSTAGSLFMIATGTTIPCRWGECPALGLPGGARAHGGAAFRIVAPSRFYHAFLRSAETAGAGFLRRLLGALLQARLAERLATTDPANADEARRTLAALGPDDVAEGWDELGVACVAFACDPLPAPFAPAPREPAFAGA